MAGKQPLSAGEVRTCKELDRPRAPLMIMAVIKFFLLSRAASESDRGCYYPFNRSNETLISRVKRILCKSREVLALCVTLIMCSIRGEVDSGFEWRRWTLLSHASVACAVRFIGPSLFLLVFIREPCPFFLFTSPIRETVQFVRYTDSFQGILIYFVVCRNCSE